MSAFVPYGKLPSGKLALGYDNAGVPNVSAIEIVTALPLVTSPDNFVGRTLFNKTTATLYTYSVVPSPQWIAVDTVPVTTGTIGTGLPPTSPTPLTGSLYYALDTAVMYVYDGTAWKPIAGQFASKLLSRRYVGDGTTTQFATGTNSVIQSEYIFVSIDGVDQVPGFDYNSVGGNVSFNTPPAAGTVVVIRAMPSVALSANAHMNRSGYTGDGFTTDYATGQNALNPNGVFVFVNGVIKIPNVDYTLVQANTTISSLTQVGGVATAASVQPHGMAVGYTFTLAGVADAVYNNQTFTVTAVPTTTTFRFSISPSAPAVATASPLMYWSPTYINDKVHFFTAPSNSAEIDIRSISNAVAQAATGEANTVSSVGTGVSLFSQKSGVDLQFKSLKSGANISLTDTGNEIQISVSTLQAFESRVGATSSTYTVTDSPSTKTSYVGVRNTSTTVTIDLSGIPQGTGNDGRRITIMDESGGAATHNITVLPGGTVQINGSAAPYVINTNYGSVTLVMDGSNWFVVNRN